MKTIKLDCFNIEVELDENGDMGTISSDLRESCPGCNDPDCYSHKEETEGERHARLIFNNAMSGIEAMILGHACAGIDITTPSYLEGIESAVAGCLNNL
jgi:hypothetical protein